MADYIVLACYLIGIFAVGAAYRLGIVAGGLGTCGLMMAGPLRVNDQDRGLIAAFALILALLACVIAAAAIRRQRRSGVSRPASSSLIPEGM